MISKELLNEVLKNTVYEENDDIIKVIYDIKANEVVFWTDEEYFNSVNIYELMHKCKEWAVGNGNSISSIVTEDVCSASVYSDVDGIIEAYCIASDTEVDSVFKACEWILNEI